MISNWPCSLTSPLQQARIFVPIPAPADNQHSSYCWIRAHRTVPACPIRAAQAPPSPPPVVHPLTAEPPLVEAPPPSKAAPEWSPGTGTGREILLQGFNWESSKIGGGGYYKDIKEKVRCEPWVVCRGLGEFLLIFTWMPGGGGVKGCHDQACSGRGFGTSVVLDLYYCFECISKQSI